MFASARVQLTLWYLLIIMTISISFSLVIYEFLSREVERFAQIQSARFESRIKDCVPTPGQPCILPFDVLLPIDTAELVSETKKRIINSLLFINATIFVVAGGLGYILAGRTLRPIKEMVEDQNRFISDASHELKTPLTSLKTAFEVHLRNKKRSLDEADDLVKESIEEVNKLQQLSESLLLLAGYRRPVQSIILEPVSLEQVTSNSIKRVKPLAKKKKITIKSKIEEVKILANADSLTDLLVILLDNAIKYSEKSSTIALDSRKIDKNYVEISVADEGIGIHKDDIDHIFERFYRADTARNKTQTGGYGLGLPIAQQIAATNQATLTVKSKENQGSTFSLKIALAKSQA